MRDGEYLKDPRVSVEVTNYRPFYIIGEVNKPGEYPYVNDMSVLNAVALAGGYTFRADNSSVYIRRNGELKETHYPADLTTKVVPGDIIRVASGSSRADCFQVDATKLTVMARIRGP